MDANAAKYVSKWGLEVSIHAPVMDAKRYQAWYQVAAMVSIHAPVMDAKTAFLFGFRFSIGFNPRARDGREW